MVGPVSVDDVGPRCLVQLKLSVESCVQRQKPPSKSQSNFPLGGIVVGPVVAGRVGGGVGLALCGKTVQAPTVNVMSSIAISPR